jgi:glycosyltransferase involved in cell wall biosynthesis
MNKPKILVLVSHYIPGKKCGGPIKSIQMICSNLCKIYQFRIVTFDRDLNETIPYSNIEMGSWNKTESAEIFYLKKNFFYFLQLYKILKSDQYKLIYTNSLFDKNMTIFVLLLNRFKFITDKEIIVAPRGELFTEALNFKKEKKKIFLFLSNLLGLYKNITFHATSEIEKETICKGLNISNDKVKVASILTLNEEQILNLPTLKHPIANQKLKIIFLARISKDKNLPFAIDVLSHLKIDVIFDIYGYLEDQEIWKLCQDKISKLPSNIRAKYLGAVDQNFVKPLISEYDIFFLPTFAENYGHVIAESLLVGTPTLISDNTPWRNLEDFGFGWDVNLNDKSKFVEIIEKFSQTSMDYRFKMRERIRTEILTKIHNEEILNENVNLFKW